MSSPYSYTVVGIQTKNKEQLALIKQLCGIIGIKRNENDPWPGYAQDEKDRLIGEGYDYAEDWDEFDYDELASFFRLLFDISKVSCREYEGHPDYDMEYDEHLVYDFDKMVLSIHRVNYESEGLTIGYWDGPTVDVRELIDWNEYRDELEKLQKP